MARAWRYECPLWDHNGLISRSELPIFEIMEQAKGVSDGLFLVSVELIDKLEMLENIGKLNLA